ncbi:TPA_asm: hypothetical protein GI720_12640, partial [Listeria monocytogenes]|nr:hypothetical protein [Listeria monocytogenes]
MHKTFISYHHAGEQDLKEAIIRKGVAGGEFIDKSVSDGDINTDLSEDTIMRKIRSEYIQDSTVVVVLIGEDTTQRPYVNSEIQAALWSNPTGLIGVVRDELYDKVYTKKKCNYEGCSCGASLRSPTYEFNNKIPFLVRMNHYALEYNKSTYPHFEDSESFCGIYKYSYFINNMETLIDEAFDKRTKSYELRKRNGEGV